MLHLRLPLILLALSLGACTRGPGTGMAGAFLGTGFPGAKPEGAGAVTPLGPSGTLVTTPPTPGGQGPTIPSGPTAASGGPSLGPGPAVGTSLVVATVAGAPGLSGAQDGVGNLARFFNPYGLGFGDSAEATAFVADTFNHSIRIVTASGETRTLAGDGSPGYADGQGLEARFRGPRGLVYQPATRTLFVADTENHCIRAVGLDGSVRTVAGHPSRVGRAEGREGSFDSPCGVALSDEGTLYVADSGNHSIRAISTQGVVRTVAGVAGAGGYLDGPGSAALFSFPRALCVGPGGLVYVSDTNNQRIRKISLEGEVGTVAGGPPGHQDGPGAEARFQFPHGISADANGVLYVSDTLNHAVRRIRSAEAGAPVDTLSGAKGQGSVDGGSDSASYFEPSALALAPDGALWVLDSRNHSLRRLAP